MEAVNPTASPAHVLLWTAVGAFSGAHFGRLGAAAGAALGFALSSGLARQVGEDRRAPVRAAIIDVDHLVRTVDA